MTITEAPTDPGLYPNLAEEVYHRDRASLSSSAVRLLVKAGGPAKFLGGVREDSDAFDIGTAAHTLLLRSGAAIVEVEADSWSAKAAREAREKARAEGKVALLTKQLAATTEMATQAWARPEVYELMTSHADSAAEMSGYALDPETWVMLRARFDWILFGPDKHVTVVDYKTTKNASPQGFARSAAEYGYHVQEAHYRRVLTELGYTVDRFVFLAQEKVPPYLTCLHEFTPEAVEVGDRIVTAGIGIYAHCMDTGVWPDYGTETNRMSLPSWALGEW